MRLLHDWLDAVSHVAHTMVWGASHRRGGRAITLFLLVVVVPLFGLLGAVCQRLDDWLFPDWRHTRVDQPLFVVGNHRTGSTFVQRTLAQDAHQFSTMRLVDLFLPSVCQRVALDRLIALDQRLGGLGAWLVAALDGAWGRDYRTVHSMGLHLPDEDDFALLTRMASGTLWEVVQESPRLRRHFWSDTEMDPTEQTAHLRAYADLARRRKHHHGGRVWLSKNPMFSNRVRGLRRVFPGARFLYLARHPVKVVGSTASLFHEGLGGLGAIEDDAHLRALVFEVCDAMYRDTLVALEGLPPAQVVCVRQEDLRADPVGTLKPALEQLGLDWTPALEAAATAPRSTGGGHRYSLERWGFDEAAVLARYADVLERWGYG